MSQFVLVRFFNVILSNVTRGLVYCAVALFVSLPLAIYCNLVSLGEFFCYLD